MIRFAEVEIGYRGKALMPPFSFEIEKGDLFGLIGPNGAGKSTLLKTLLGVLRPISGTIEFESGRRPAIGYVPQRDSIETVLPLSVNQVVEMGLRKGAANKTEGVSKQERVEHALELLGISDFLRKPFRNLSGGQKQRTLFARALVSEPEVLIFDEPTNGMDIPTEKSTLELINKLRSKTGCTTLLVTHLISSVTPYVNRVAFIDHEKDIFSVGSAKEMFTEERMTHLYGRPIRIDTCGQSITVVAE